LALIKFKRTTTTNNPSSLEFGEPCFIEGNSQLLIGTNSGENKLIENPHAVDLNREIITADYPLNSKSPSHHYLDPQETNQNIQLPFYSRFKGLRFVIRNISVGSGNLNIIESPIDLNILYYIEPGREGIFIYDGVEWQITIF
jgi:hypothetical protein